MARRVTIIVTFEADESRVSSDYYDAQDDMEAQAHQFAAEFGDVKSVRVSLTGWQKPTYERH